MQKNKTKKKSYVKWIVFGVFAVFTILAIVFAHDLFGEESVFNKTVSENSFLQAAYTSIPHIIKCIQIITIAIFAAVVIRFVLSKMFTHNERALTVVKLLSSFLGWIIGIVAVLLILKDWGVNTNALLASVGILSLIIGLGAQSLIADILAGLFIVVEGEFLIGDIVVIDGWRGTVQEIGIRVTKIVDAGGNVKIVNNSEIRSIVNQTQELSVAKAYIGIEYGESIPRVEIVIRDNLARIKENIPAIVEGPFYKGVDTLGASSVDLLFLAKCKEEDIYQVQRDLNRELKIMFDENGINVPFPQIVLNQPTEFPDRKEGDDSKARAFVEEQKELSKDVEEKVE